ncbi:MAG: hypothetical protein ACI8YQ_004279 [Polaribacter sp.]|jgi:hypothetical protein
MYNFLVKNGQLLSFGVGLLITIIYFVGAVGGDSPDRFNFGLMTAIALSIICALFMVGFGLYQVASNPKGSLKGIITFGLLIGLFAALYATSDPTLSPATTKEFGLSEGTSKMISGAMLTTLLLLGATCLAFILSEIRNFFK